MAVIFVLSLRVEKDVTLLSLLMRGMRRQKVSLLLMPFPHEAVLTFYATRVNDCFVLHFVTKHYVIYGSRVVY